MKKFMIGIGCVLLVILLLLTAAMIWSANRTTAAREMRRFPDPTPRHDMGKTLVIFYSLTSNTREIAARIAEMTAGTLFEIETEQAYPASPMLYYTAWRELNGGALPELKNTLGDISSYDTIFVGAPVWWFTVPGPMRAFLAQTDFSGKTVIPFCTQGGNAGNFFEHFEQEARSARIAEGKEFSNVNKTDVAELDAQISEWLGAIARQRSHKDEDIKQ